MQTTQVVTPKLRCTFQQVFAPRLNELSKKMEYSICLLVPKKDAVTLSLLAGAIKAAVAKTWPAKAPGGLRMPFKDGDSPKKDGSPRHAAYAGHFYINAKSSNKPQVVRWTGEFDAAQRKVFVAVEDASEVSSGDYVRCSLNAGAYDMVGNQGVALYLNNVEWVAAGEAIGGGSAASDFAN